MEFRFPQPILYWPMEKEGSGSEGKRRLSTGMMASRRCIGSKR